MLAFYGIFLATIVVVNSAPHIIYIITDDQDYYQIGYNDDDYETDELNALAESGTVFTRFYSHPFCSPTRAGDHDLLRICETCLTRHSGL
jgi:arylsulfatase/uncharacterized sulfatase